VLKALSLCPTMDNTSHVHR